MDFRLFYQFFLGIILMLIFLKGYFPITKNETVVIDPPTTIEDVKLDLEKLYKPQIDRLILVIIDALRYDFITKDNMPALHSSMNCLLKVKVEAPTVTLPRLKALTTGAVPQFVDIVLNLGAKAKVDDSFLHRANQSGKTMVFYGDNTWLMMFPDLFKRSDGTTSFFVNDFTEVDDNITRHIDDELEENDWDMMFLHYLGLDHIGHVQGPFSTLIQPKLQEMDAIIAKIINKVNTWHDRTLVLVTGDHGMKDSGGHGGTTYAETHVPLVVYHNKGINCSSTAKKSKISQSDIATTISALFGIAMPANSVGKLLPNLMKFENSFQLLYTLHYNTIILQSNMQKKTETCEGNLYIANELMKQVIKDGKSTVGNLPEAISLYSDCLKDMSEELIATSVKQDAFLLIFAIVGSLNCFLVIFNMYFGYFDWTGTLLATIVTAIFLVHNLSSPFNINVIQYPLIALMAMLVVINFTTFLESCTVTLLSKLLPFIMHALLLPSSSYIEEEHEIFYFFVSSVSIFIAFVNYLQTKRVGLATIMPLTVIEMIRMGRGLNTNDKWFVSQENQLLLQVFHIFSLLVTYGVSNRAISKFLLLQPITLMLIHCYKFYFEDSVQFAQFVWAAIAIQLLPIPSLANKLRIRAFHERLINVWVLTLLFLLRPHNAILVPIMITCSLIFKKCLNPLRKTNDLVTLHVWLGYTFFFLQGHRNSIADIDLAPGYIGLSTYIPEIVGFLTICHTYGFITLGHLLLFQQIQGETRIMKSFIVIISYRLFILFVIYLIIFIHRGHLFVWSVFAPKLLIESAHTFVLFSQVFLYYIYRQIVNCFTRKNKTLKE